MPSASFPAYGQQTGNLPNLHFVVGRFILDTDGADTPEIVAGKGFTVTRQGTGIYRVTFNKQVKLVSIIPTIFAPSPSLVASHKAINNDNNYVDITTADYDGNLADGAQDVEGVDFVAVVMTAKLPS